MRWEEILKERKYSYNEMKAVFDEAAMSVKSMDISKYIKSSLLYKINMFWMRLKEVGDAVILPGLDRNMPRYTEFEMEEVKKRLAEMLRNESK